jgi:hypothetical protein
MDVAVVILGVLLVVSVLGNVGLWLVMSDVAAARDHAEHERDMAKRELEAFRSAETLPPPFNPRDTVPGANSLAERRSTMRPPKMPSDVSELKRTIRGFSSYPPKAG